MTGSRVGHRPVRIDYRINGTPMSERERNAAFLTGWAQAMAPLPTLEGGRLHPRAVPARVFYDHGLPDSALGLIPATLHLMHNPDPNGLRINLMDPTVGYNTFNILGNMRDVHPMAQWALAAMATWKEKDVSVTLDARTIESTTITVFTPDTTAGNLGRAHPGGDPIGFPLRPR